MAVLVQRFSKWVVSPHFRTQSPFGGGAKPEVGFAVVFLNDINDSDKSEINF